MSESLLKKDNEINYDEIEKIYFIKIIYNNNYSNSKLIKFECFDDAIAELNKIFDFIKRNPHCNCYYFKSSNELINLSEFNIINVISALSIINEKKVKTQEDEVKIILD